MYIEKIKSPADVKNLTLEQLKIMAGEVRSALLQKLSIKGGHVGPNLGMVEATIALHYVFDSPTDKFVFDVSHQCYAHKMLTGRNYAYLDESQYGSVSGYTNPEESEHDFFTVGHTSTSVSLASGLAKARDLKNESFNVVAIIGDGSLSGGEALEGLDFASELKSNFIIVVNDNEMSIAENHGGLYSNLKLLRDTEGKAECNLFKAMGLDYCFVSDGNDMQSLISVFNEVKNIDHPVVVHIHTEKGKGFAPAEENKERFHWSMPFDLKTGDVKVSYDAEDYHSLTARYLLKKMEEDPKVVAITAGTPTVMGFTPDLRKKAGKQFVDVGIAEEQAVAMSSALAAGGARPVFGVYSSFIQRTYDQLSQDLCINNNAATILVYAGSVFGLNDVTHLGFFDIPVVSNIPNMVYLAPTTKEEFFAMTDWAISQNEHPVAVRVPMQVVSSDSPVDTDYSDLNKYSMVHRGSKVALIGLGSFYHLAGSVAEALKTEGIDATLINPRFITGLDSDLLDSLKADHSVVVSLEDGCVEGGFGDKIARFYGDSEMKVLVKGLAKHFEDRYNAEEVCVKNRITVPQIVEDIKKLL